MFRNLEIREGWIAVVGLLFMLLFVTWSIQAAQWTEGLWILQEVVLVGGIVGILFAKSRAPNRLAHLLSMLIGLTWSTFLTSRVLAVPLGLSTEMAVMELERRIQEFFFIVINGGTNADNHVFLLMLTLLLWLLAYFCAWAVFRWQRVWWAIIISGLALILNINYAPMNLTGYLLGYLFFALLLVVRTSLASYQMEWQRAGVGYSPELVYSFLRTGLVISVLAILLAWLAPEALANRPLQQVWDRVGEPWRRFQDQSSRIFQDLNYQNEQQLIYSDRWMKFGGPVELPDTPVMDVQATSGRYWRVMVFHEYTGEGWENTDTDTILVGKDERDIAFPEVELRREMTQTITLHRDLGTNGTLVAASQPLRAGIPLRAVVSYITHREDVARSPDDSLYPPVPGDPSVLYARVPLEAGETYEVTSSLSSADEESLRQASTNYPSWVTPRYLQLPDSLAPRIPLLAREITANIDTPYDKAKAIESYLRQIPYNEKIEGPAPGQDGVEYFLFEAQEGYCDYYSSAMVVMLRAVGIPARYVRGFSQGVKEEGVYHLLESDGHAWPEVFFPGYGWIEFEPTGGEPPLVRARSQPNSEADRSQDRSMARTDWRDMIEDEIDPSAFDSAASVEAQAPWKRLALWGGLVVGLLLAGTALFALYSNHRRRRTESMNIGERVYEDLVNWAKRLFRISPMAHQTPHEYAGVVAQSIPQSRPAVEKIAGLYVKERFGNKTVSGAEAEVAWHQAWSALWQRWFSRRFDRVRDFWWKLVPPKDLEVPPSE